MLADLRFAASTEYVDGGTTEDGKACWHKNMWVPSAPSKMNGWNPTIEVDGRLFSFFQLGDILEFHVNFHGCSDIHNNVYPSNIKKGQSRRHNPKASRCTAFFRTHLYTFIIYHKFPTKISQRWVNTLHTWILWEFLFFFKVVDLVRV